MIVENDAAGKSGKAAVPALMAIWNIPGNPIPPYS